MLTERYKGLAISIAGREDLPAMFEPWATKSLTPTFNRIPVAPVIDRELRKQGENHLQKLQKENSNLFDGAVMALDKISPGFITSRPDTYFNAIKCSEPLAEEWLNQSHTPLRDRIDQRSNHDPLHNGSGRCSAMSLSCILVVNTKDQMPFIILGHRNTDVALYPQHWHVAPSGMLEWSQHSVRDTLNLELREEIAYNLSKEALKDSLAQAKVLGIGYDLLRLRSEICVLMEISTDYPPLLSFTEFDQATYLPYHPKAIKDFIACTENICPPGAAALALALWHLQS